MPCKVHGWYCQKCGKFYDYREEFCASCATFTLIDNDPSEKKVDDLDYEVEQDPEGFDNET